MKSFKEFTKIKDPVVITNTHGKHTREKDPVVITNTHGKHAKIKEEVNESTSTQYDKWLNTRHNDFGKVASIQQAMQELEDEHAADVEGKNALNAFTKDSRELSRKLVRSHETKVSLGNHPIINDSAILQHIKTLDEKSFKPLARKNLHTWSGANFDIRDAQHVGLSPQGNKVFKQPTYLSSSLSKEIAAKFATRTHTRYEKKSPIKHILHWELEKNQPVGMIGSNSMHPEEHEVLIPRTDATLDKYHIEYLFTEEIMGPNDTMYHIHHVKRIPQKDIKNYKETDIHKFYHQVSFAEKDKAKREGMQFDKDAKKWYHISSHDSKQSDFPRA